MRALLPGPPVRFDPLPVLSIVVCAAAALLIGLGLWQVRRAVWKAELGAAYRDSLNRPPAITLEDGLCTEDMPLIRTALIEPVVRDQYRPVRLFGRRPHDGRPGWRLLSVIEAPDCRGGSVMMLAETGFETTSGRTSTTTLLVAPWPKKSFLAAPNNVTVNQWHWLDADQIANTTGLRSGQFNTDIYLTSAERRPQWLNRTPPARHVAYSATWFLLAVAVFGVYVLYHVRARRLEITS